MGVWLRQLWARIRVAYGLCAPETIQTDWDRLILEAEAKAFPERYFTCNGCGDGPWHISWYGEFDSPRKRIGPCCSGAC